jgi:hypothetical protein
MMGEGIYVGAGAKDVLHSIATILVEWSTWMQIDLIRVHPQLLESRNPKSDSCHIERIRQDAQLDNRWEDTSYFGNASAARIVKE